MCALNGTSESNPISSVKRKLVGIAAVSLCLIVAMWFAVDQLNIHYEKAKSEKNLQDLYRNIENVLQGNLSHAQGISRTGLMSRTLAGEISHDSPLLQTELDAVNSTLDSKLVYVVDAEGVAVACSKNPKWDQIIGTSYKFRPYFTEAIAGKATIFFTVGVTTKEPGLYCSAPVWSSNLEAPVGVVVIKYCMGEIKRLVSSFDTPLLILSPEGMVIVSNRLEWIYKPTRELAPEEKSRLRETRQFPGNNFNNPVFKITNGLVEYDGNRYRAFSRKMDGISSLSIMILAPEKYPLQIYVVLVGTIVLIAFLIGTNMWSRQETATARAAEEVAVARFKAAFEQASVGIALIDLKQSFYQTNRKFCEIAGRDNEQLKKLNLFDLLKNNDRKEVVEGMEEIVEGDIDEFVREKIWVRGDGQEVWINLFIKIVCDVFGNPEQFLCVVADIHDRKMAEHALEEARENLERRVEERTRDLNQANRELLGANTALRREISQRKEVQSELLEAKEYAEAANRSRGEFLANISHEIRNPLNGILGLLEILTEEGLNKKLDQAVRVALASGRGLANVFNDILDLTKLQAGKLEFQQEPFRPAQIIAELEDVFRPVAEEKGLYFTLEVDPRTPDVLSGDVRQLRIILFNLVGNALKFTEKGEVRLEMYPLSRKDSDETVRLLFSVSDTGIGVPDDKIDYVFESFTRGDDWLTRSYPGAGLGLAVVKRLVETLNGTLTVTSKPEIGTTFYFSLDLRQVDESLSPDFKDVSAAVECGGQGKSILLAVNSALNRLTISRYLEKCGYQVTSVISGVQALSELNKVSYDCLLMDVRMDEHDGLETSRRIRWARKARFDPNMPIIALADAPSENDQDMYRQAGINDFLALPLNMNELMETLDRVLS